MHGKLIRQHRSASYKTRTKSGAKRRAQRTLLAEAQNWRCAYCHCCLEPNTATTEHIIPAGLGGLNHFFNCVAVCLPCNQEAERASRWIGTANEIRAHVDRIKFMVEWLGDWEPEPYVKFVPLLE